MTRELPTYTIDELEELSATQFEEMTNEDAVNLGLVAIEVITEWELSLAVDIVLDGDLVFRAKLGETGPGNDPWLAGKAAVVNKYGEPSLLVKLRREASGTEFVEETVDGVILRAHGGSVPLRVNGAVVGTITMSGEPDVLDHAAAAEAVRRFAAE
jgi:uncharacterized protein (UPF0303 family)